MANFDSGVSAYVTAVATVVVHFPVDLKGNADIRCVQCPYYRAGTRRCQLNFEVVSWPEKHVGAKCPLEEIDNEI